MPGVLHNALNSVAHGEADVFPSLAPGPQHGTPRIPTAFENCWMARKTGESRVKGRFDGRPCRSDEEESCNKVHGTCARTLKFSAERDSNYGLTFDKVDPPCAPPKKGEKDSAGAAAAAAAKAGGASFWEKSNSADKCNSRLIDMPYGLMNPEAAKDETKSMGQVVGVTRAARVEPSRSVWGLAVHGKSGTFSFDSGGTHAADYIYSVAQGNGLPADYYVCDSRTHPSACALIGGNLRHSCAEWYDPRQCNFCEDHGSSLTCEIRGWNAKYREWARVPIYPRDLLGEMYRGEFRDVMSRPMWASITIPKWTLKAPVKEMPSYMVQDSEPLEAVSAWKKGPNATQHAAAAMMTESRGPHPLFMASALALQGLPDSQNSRKRTAREQKQSRRAIAEAFF